MEKTPKTSDELKLLQARMGRRTISIPEAADHSWTEDFQQSPDKNPAMDVILENSLAHTPTINLSVTVSLSQNANIKSDICSKLVGLSTHQPIQHFGPQQHVLKPVGWIVTKFGTFEHLCTACPICEQICPSDFLEVHASFCGESVADVVKSRTERVDENGIFSICVARDQMLERGIKQWQRQKKSSPKNPLRVSLIGKAGIDNGALRKEFLTEMMAGINQRFFEGGDNGKNPKYSMTDLDKHNFKTVGEIFAVSIAQGGPPPNFLMQWCYNYISTGEMDQEAISERDVTDPELIELIKEIEAADNTTLTEFTDRTLSCGYTGAVSTQRKEDIVRSVVLHSKVRLLPMLQQICSGMKLYGLLSLVQQETDICRQLFVPGSFSKKRENITEKTCLKRSRVRMKMSSRQKDIPTT
ncbi:uncharacterized protein LOC125739985 isoform X2 [Brienomyrus brachyistius]|uniref:uncharacterized protein LOC125739985 isoform X2 n=1 Tax=Brienomyrus brachyistius TaxID=42636 RepID=UPI0020B2B82E|nr:uncharacterized protein LOC125739985 isoform X2 [Brienomyrus brachyistius]